MGSKDRKVRDAKAAELLAKGFAMIPARPEPPAAAAPKPAAAPEAAPTAGSLQATGSDQLADTAAEPATEGSGAFIKALAIGVLLLLAFLGLLTWKKRSRKNKFRRRL